MFNFAADYDTAEHDCWCMEIARGLLRPAFEAEFHSYHGPVGMHRAAGIARQGR